MNLQVLADLTEVEAQNFDDIDIKKLSKGQQESVTTIIWDYIHSVWIRYLLDDASQVGSLKTQLGTVVVFITFLCDLNSFLFGQPN